jgi:hypothetical protein
LFSDLVWISCKYFRPVYEGLLFMGLLVFIDGLPGEDRPFGSGEQV